MRRRNIAVEQTKIVVDGFVTLDSLVQHVVAEALQQHLVEFADTAYGAEKGPHHYFNRGFTVITVAHHGGYVWLIIEQ